MPERDDGRPAAASDAEVNRGPALDAKGPDAKGTGATAAEATTSPAAATKRTTPSSGPRLGVLGTARWVWRQLTSMRTALMLLMLLAVAALPGSIWPQRSIDPARVEDYLDAHPRTGVWMDRLSLFDVYSSPWFAAVYLLLTLSLVGCIVPRIHAHAKAWRTPPPRVPRNLARLPGHVEATVDAAPEDVVAAARRALKGRRFRADTAPGTLSAEGGMLREVGNIGFHLGFVVIIVAVAVGHLYGWKGEVIVPEGEAFSSSLAGYDTFRPGPLVDAGRLDPFTVKVDSMDVRFETARGAGKQMGQPRVFSAETTVTDGSGSRGEHLGVNHPLNQGDAGVYLLGNGYAPLVTVRDAKGQVLYRQPTPFLPQDNNYRSVGAVKVTSASPKQLGFVGLLLPTVSFDQERGPISLFPDKADPALVLTAYEGELFPGGRPQNVYNLDTRSMSQLKDAHGNPVRILLRPGRTAQLPDGRGSITYEATPRWAGLSVRYDPGKDLALAASVLALLALVLSLTVRRRRFFVTTTSADDGRTVVRIGALAKGEDPRIQQAAEQLWERIARDLTSTRTASEKA